AGTRWGDRECARRAPPAHHPEPLDDQLGEVDRPAGTGGAHADRDRAGPQRQPDGKPHHPYDLRDRSGSGRDPDRVAQPSVFRRDIGKAGLTPAGHARGHAIAGAVAAPASTSYAGGGPKISSAPTARSPSASRSAPRRSPALSQLHARPPTPE